MLFSSVTWLRRRAPALGTTCVVVAQLAGAQVPSPAPPADLATLPQVQVVFDARHDRLTIEFPPEDIPAADGMMFMRSVPPHQAMIPVAGTISWITTEVVGDGERVLPRDLLHHVNLTDPTRRELFLPISLHLFAASKETPRVGVPRLLLGLPLEQGQRLLLTAMVANARKVAYHRARIRVTLGYRPAGRLFPLWRAYPWVVDAMFPLGKGADGSKAFDLPPGRTVRSWEASPAIPGYILGIGGHVHDYAVAVDFVDVSTGETIWNGVPERDSAGHVILLPVTRFFNWHRLGVHIVPSHRYRISVTYENPTGQLLRDGGMGAVAGLFIPDRDVQWPPLDTTGTLYRQDLAATFAPSSEMMMTSAAMGDGH